MRCFLKPKNDALKGAKKALKLKKSILKPKNDALKMKGNAKKATLKIHSLAKFTALKYLRRTQNVTRRPGRATATSPGQSEPKRGSVTLGVMSTPNGRPWRGQKPIPFAFLLLLLQSAIHAGGLPRVSARFAHLTLGWWLIAPLGRTVRMDSFNVKMFRSSDVLKFRSPCGLDSHLRTSELSEPPNPISEHLITFNLSPFYCPLKMSFVICHLSFVTLRAFAFCMDIARCMRGKKKHGSDGAELC